MKRLVPHRVPSLLFNHSPGAVGIVVWVFRNYSVAHIGSADLEKPRRIRPNPSERAAEGGCGVVGRHSSTRHAPRDERFLENDDHPDSSTVRECEAQFQGGRGANWSTINAAGNMEQRLLALFDTGRNAGRRLRLPAQHPSSPRCNASLPAGPLGHSERAKPVRRVSGRLSHHRLLLLRLAACCGSMHRPCGELAAPAGNYWPALSHDAMKMPVRPAFAQRSGSS